MKPFITVALLGLSSMFVAGSSEAPQAEAEGYDIIVSSAVEGSSLQFDWVHLTDSYTGGMVGLEGSGPVTAPDTISLPPGDFAVVVRNLTTDRRILVDVVERRADHRPDTVALSVASLTVIAVIDGVMSIGGLPAQ